jgi:hypothetical protein
MTIARRVRRRVRAALPALVLVAALAPPARAFDEVPDPTWMTNGTVYAVVRAGDHVYIGGQFTRVRSTPPGQPGSTVRSIGIARLNAATGEVDRTWKVEVTRTDGKRATVYAIAVAGGKVFFGGKFDLVDGVPRMNFAAVSEAGGVLDPGVDANVGGSLAKPIRAMIASPTTVYVGGYFTNVDGVGRSFLAAFDTSGTLLPWRPRTAGSVRSLLFDCAGDSVYAGGLFEQAAGQTGSLVTRDSVARFDAATGALEAWATRDAEIGNGSVAYDLALSCATQRLFVGIGGQNFLYAFDVADDDGEALWIRQTSGNVQTVAVNDQGTSATGDDRVYFGGHFGGGVTYPAGTCSQSKPKTARFGVTDLNGNCDLTWRPNFEGKFYGPWDILVTDAGDRVWVGGQFTQVCDGTQSPAPCVDRYFLARFTDL